MASNSKYLSPQHWIQLGEIIETKKWRGIIYAGEWLGVSTEGEIEPREYDTFSISIAVPRRREENAN